MRREQKYAIIRDGQKVFLTSEELEQAMRFYVKDMARAIVEAAAPEEPTNLKRKAATRGANWFIEDLVQELYNRIEIPE